MTQTESNIQSSHKREKLAMDGGPKAVGEFQGEAQPKIGVEEFFSIAKRFGFNDQAMTRLKQAVSNDDLPEGGPNLAPDADLAGGTLRGKRVGDGDRRLRRSPAAVGAERKSPAQCRPPVAAARHDGPVVAAPGHG